MVKIFQIFTLVVTAILATPAVAQDSRKACDYLKEIIDQKVYALESKFPTAQVGAAARDLAFHLTGEAHSRGSRAIAAIQDRFTPAYDELMADTSLTPEDRGALRTQIEAIVIQEIETKYGYVSSSLAAFIRENIRFAGVSNSRIISACQHRIDNGHIVLDCAIEVGALRYNVMIDFHRAGTLFQVIGPDSKEIARLKSLEDLPAVCRQYYRTQ